MNKLKTAVLVSFTGMSALTLVGCGTKSTIETNTATNASVSTGNSQNNWVSNNTTNATTAPNKTANNTTSPSSSSNTQSKPLTRVSRLEVTSMGTVWVLNPPTFPANKPYKIYLSSYKTAKPSPKLKASTSTKLATIAPKKKENGIYMYVKFVNLYKGPSDWVLFNTSVLPKDAPQSYINFLYALNVKTHQFEKITSYKVGGGSSFSFAIKRDFIYYKQVSPANNTLQTKYKKFGLKTQTTTSLSSKPNVKWVN